MENQLGIVRVAALHVYGRSVMKMSSSFVPEQGWRFCTHGCTPQGRHAGAGTRASEQENIGSAEISSLLKATLTLLGLSDMSGTG